MATAAPPSILAPSPVQAPERNRANCPVSNPHLSVLIVNYCQWEETARLVRQIRAAACTQAGLVEVVVVDNHSPPHPLASRLRRLPEVSLRRWGHNRGFARAVNEGCRLSRGDWFLLLNPDVTLPRNFLRKVLALVQTLTDEDGRAGIVGFHLRNPDGTQQLSSGPFPTLPALLAGLAMPRARRKYHLAAPRQRCQVPWVTGCCLLVRHDCLKQVGGLDEDFFLYYEDVDLCRRAQAEGWSVWYEPGIRAIHHRPLHARQVPAFLRLVTRQALLTYGAKHWPEWQLRFLAGIVRWEAWLRQHWAVWLGDDEAAAHFGDLQAVATDMAGGFLNAARRRLGRAVRREERFASYP